VSLLLPSTTNERNANDSTTRPSLRSPTHKAYRPESRTTNERRPPAERDAATIELDFGETGRIPAVAQDADTEAVLMLAYVTPEAVEQTRETGLAHYYSRSREELWQKGGTSGRAGIRG
jgi:hypothetical protein